MTLCWLTTIVFRTQLFNCFEWSAETAVASKKTLLLPKVSRLLIAQHERGKKKKNHDGCKVHRQVAHYQLLLLAWTLFFKNIFCATREKKLRAVQVQVFCPSSHDSLSPVKQCVFLLFIILKKLCSVLTKFYFARVFKKVRSTWDSLLMNF